MGHCYLGTSECNQCENYETLKELIKFKEFHTNSILSIFFPLIDVFIYVFILIFLDQIGRNINYKYPQGEIEAKIQVPENFFLEFVSVWDGKYEPLKKRPT